MQKKLDVFWREVVSRDEEKEALGFIQMSVEHNTEELKISMELPTKLTLSEFGHKYVEQKEKIDENFFDFITEYTCAMERNRKAKESIKKLFENKSFKDFKVRVKYVEL
jgi:hypothetical protein